MKRELNAKDIEELGMIPACICCKFRKIQGTCISCSIIPDYSKKWANITQNLFNNTCALFKINSREIENLAWYTVEKTGKTVTYTKGSYTYQYGIEEK